MPAAIALDAGFLTRQWYPPDVAEGMRWELAAALRQQVEKVGTI